jgi:hypothetical protein
MRDRESEIRRQTSPILLSFIILLSGVRQNSLGTAATIGLLYQTQMIVEFGAVGGMRIDRGN